MNLTEKLLSANAVNGALVPVAVEGFEGAFIRQLSAGERGAWESGNVVVRGKTRTIAPNSRERLLILCLVDSDGKRIFRDEHLADLGKLRGDVVDAVYEQCVEVCKLDPDAVETLRKNLPKTPTDDSRSA